MDRHEDSHLGILAAAGRAGEGLGLLLGCLAVVQDYDCCRKQTELDSAGQSDARRLWLGAESGGLQRCPVNLALIQLPRLG